MDRLSSKQLMSLCRERGLSTVGCLEKADLVALLRLNTGAVVDVAQMSCARCKATSTPTGGRLLRCARCNGVYYCGQECQSAHWPEHKPKCAPPFDATTHKLVANWRKLNDNLLMQAARVLFSRSRAAAAAAARVASTHGVVVSLEMSEGGLRVSSIEAKTRSEIYELYLKTRPGPPTDPIMFALKTTDAIRGLVFVDTYGAEFLAGQTAEEMLTQRPDDLASIEDVLARMNA